MNIRTATISDAPLLVDFNQKMALETEGKHLDTATLTLGVRAVFDDANKGFYVVADDEGSIVGGLLVTFEWSDWRNKWFWWIQSVYIRPEARGKRLYSKLYEFVKERAIAAGNVYGIRLYVEHENTHAQRVYEKLGMLSSTYLMYADQL